MEFRPILVRCSAGKKVKDIPKELVAYKEALQGVPPTTEIFTGDPDLDLKTLHASLGFRDAFVRLGLVEVGGVPKLDGNSLHSALKLDWKSGTQHEISDNGQDWVETLGRSIKYEVALSDGRSTKTVYLSVQFGEA